MDVLHACWLGAPPGDPGRFALWAESSEAPGAALRGQGRPPKVRDHPYAVSQRALGRLLPPTAAHRADAAQIVLVLPTRSDGPLPSPELIRDEVLAERGAVQPKSWRIPALGLDADDIVVLLSDLGRSDSVAVGGASLHHLLDLIDFAADLVRRGRLLPIVAGDPPSAAWRPLLTGPDVAWTRVLAAAAPPSLLATPQPDPGHSAGNTAEPVGCGWAALLDALVDAAARARLGARRLSVGGSGSTATRAWLAALTGRERRMATINSVDAASLADALAEWQADAAIGDVRACFRLADPPADADPDAVEWQLRFGLQDADEPTAVVDATAVWASRGGTLPGLGRQLSSPQETFLAELGKAARLYPQLDAALRTARPAALAMDIEEAHQFLREAAPTLSMAGFGVLLPGWWTRPAARLGLKVTASTPPQPGMVSGGSGGVGFGAIADFRYDLAVGDDTLTVDELAALSDAKSSLVRLRGQWIELDARRLAAGLRIAGTTGQASVGELLRLGLGVDAALDELPITEVAADGWLGDLLAGDAERRLEPVQPPTSFIGQLRPYQARGLSWLDFLGRSGLGGVLADDMGLGKTVQLLALLAGDPAADDRPGRTRRGPAPRARHQAESADLPHVAGRELAAGGGPVHSRAAGARPPRSRTRPRCGVHRRSRGERIW